MSAIKTTKPRIYQSRGKWWCSQGVNHAYGQTAREAYTSMIKQREMMDVIQDAWKKGGHVRVCI